MTDELPKGKIYEAILGVMSGIGAIGKNNQNTHQNYNFRGIDDVYNALQPALIANRIFLTPYIVNVDHEIIDTGAGKRAYHTMLTVRFRFYAEDGSYVDCETVGEALDTSDKATNKAMSNAFKYAMFQVFCIPTTDFFQNIEDNDIQIAQDHRPPYNAPPASRPSNPPANQPPPPPAPNPNEAANVLELITSKQLGFIRYTAQEKNLDAEFLCKEEYGCAISELSKKSASEFIDALDKREANSVPPEPQTNGAPPPPPPANVSNFPSHSGVTAAAPPAAVPAQPTVDLPAGMKKSLASQRTAITNLIGKHNLDAAATITAATAGRSNNVADIGFDEAAKLIRELSAR